MWKRLQTLYLGISTALIFSMFFCKFATIIGPAGEELSIGYHEKLPYLVMLIMLFTAHVAATASFKAPFLQARVAMIAALMSVGFQIWLTVDIIRFFNEMTFHITALFPLASAVLNFMAAKRALVEEMTITAVKSMKSARRK
ncbi:MAG: DUF4293 family protein [Bacteroidales bacterium]|nr:DUF4293 family protein [Bacteroidales bacterium]